MTFPKEINITLELNGKTLDVPIVENNYGIVVLGNLIIRGKGEINAGTYGIGVSSTGNLTIEVGTYKCLTGDYLIGSWGTTSIKGGLFAGNYSIANGFENGTVKILNGTFYNKEENIILGNVEIFSGAFNQNVDEYLTDGIEMKMYNGLYYTGKIYKIMVEETNQGVVKTSTEAVAEQSVKVEAKTNDGYELSNIKVTHGQGKIVAVSNSEFVMPESNVNIFAIFESTTLDNTPRTGNSNIIVFIGTFLGTIAMIALSCVILKIKIN